VRQDERLLLGSSFGAAAAAYAEHRPDYAHAAVRRALERAPGSRVLDLGAGTGKLTGIHGFLASRPETAHGEFNLPMLTGVLRVRRR
jgi:16S rRNA G1207 methylase RsmC